MKRTRVWIGLLIALASLAPAAAQPPRASRISFLPPPLDGTVSLGIYNEKGALVRVLHREAELSDFEAGADALNTAWDGNTDAGEPLPPGKYRARGYLVGDVEIDGIGFFFNDWVVGEDSPRIEHIDAIEFEDRQLFLAARTAGGTARTIACDANGTACRTSDRPLPKRECPDDAIACARGRERSVWIVAPVEQGSGRTDVKQLSAGGEVLRRLRLEPDEPQPRAIAAAAEEDRIFLLEENALLQRLRALTLVETKRESGEVVSDWKVEFEKKIVAHAGFTVESGVPIAVGNAKSLPDKVPVRLTPNPLQNDERTRLDVAAGFDPNGSFLKTADGLPLRTVSDTPHLRRIVISPRDENSVDVFQDDGAVVEQFRVRALDQMMAFDAGEFELK